MSKKFLIYNVDYADKLQINCRDIVEIFVEIIQFIVALYYDLHSLHSFRINSPHNWILIINTFLITLQTVAHHYIIIVEIVAVLRIFFRFFNFFHFFLDFCLFFLFLLCMTSNENWIRMWVNNFFSCFCLENNEKYGK